jgi:hypothetical protein
MGALIESLQTPPRALWLDANAYGARLLAGGQAPWLDIAACTTWQRKLQGLLKNEVATLPATAVVAAWLDAQPALRAAMAAKSRAVYALKTLLADQALRAHLLELTRALRAGLPGQPLVLVLPAPRAWVALAHEQAQGRRIEVDDEDADSAALYLADFLQTFAEAGLDGLLLVEDAAQPPLSAATLACYQSVANVAAHLRWDLGLLAPTLAEDCGALPAGWSYAIAPHALAPLPTARALPAAYWSGTAAEPGDFVYAEIPAEAQPEAVLERLAALRA